MATLTVYENGCSAGRGNNAPVGGKRGKVDGWSASSVRGHRKWLWSVDTGRLDGDGYGVTLTLRDTPASQTDWSALVRRLHRAFNEAGITRWHWVVEWQRRGTPHLHLAVYSPAGWSAPGSPITDIMTFNRLRRIPRQGRRRGLSAAASRSSSRSWSHFWWPSRSRHWASRSSI